jgi:hypothetical protein
MSIPRAFERGLKSHFREHLSPRRRTYGPARLDPSRDATGCVSRGDQGRWLRTGAERTPNARRPKLHGPGATSVRVTGPSKACAVPPVRRAGAGSGPKRWLGNLRPPGAMQSKPQTSRAGRWRKGGLAETASDCLRAARRDGPWVRQDPGVPRRPHPGLACCLQQSERKTRCGNDGGCVDEPMVWNAIASDSERPGGEFSHKLLPTRRLRRHPP